MVVGYTHSEGAAGDTDCLIVKLDKDGNKEWMKYIGGSSGDSLTKVAKYATGGYIGCGETRSGNGGGLKLILIRFSESGAV